MTNEIIIKSMDDAERAAKAMAASGFFQDTKQASQAVVKILAGQELGFGPFASMTGVKIIQNKPVLAANLMAAAVKRQGKYNYRIARLDDTGCELIFLENGQEVGKSKFDKSDAEKAGLLTKDNWKKYTRNMYFARAISNGQKWYAPDVFNGATVYTPDELGAVENEDGSIASLPTGDNPDPIDDKTWEHFLALCHEAEELKIEFAIPDRAVTMKADLIEYGKNLRGYVNDAKAQSENQ